jgi:tight adherence protein C
MSGDLVLFAAFFGFIMAAVVGAGYLFMRFGSAGATGESGLLDERQDWTEVAGNALGALGSWNRKPGSKSDSLRKQLFRAGYRSASSVQVFSGIQVANALWITVTTVWLVTNYKGSIGEAVIPGLCAVGFGFLIPHRFLDLQVRARAHRLRQAIPPAVDLLVLALEAGQSLDQAMLDTAQSLRGVFPDLSSELMFTHLEMRAGTSKQEALRHLAERSGEEELRKMALLLIDGERFGTSLGPALRTHGKYLRTRMRQLAQEAARKLTVKLVLPVFFLIFPSVLLVTLGPAYLQMRQFLDSFLK